VERKRSLIVAGAVSGTLLATSTVYALTGGLLDRPAHDGAGTLAPVTATIEDPSTTAPPPGHSFGDEWVERREASESGAVPGRVYEGADDDD